MMFIVLATPSADLEDRVRLATGGAFLALPPGPIPAAPADLFAQLDGAPLPDVILLDAAPGTEEALALGTRFDREWPGISVVLVSDAGAEIVLPAMRAGIRDVIHPGAEAGEIRDVIDRAGRVAAARSAAAAALSAPASTGPAATGRVITVISPKGGVGKTTVAANLAVGLSGAEPGSTVLVDLDVQFGDVTTALNLAPEYTLADAAHGPAAQDAMVLKTFLTRHETGLYTLCGPESPAAGDSITGEDISRLLQTLASEFRYVIVDTSAGLTDHTLAALDHTTDLVLVTSLDVPSVRALRKVVDTLGQLEMSTGRSHVVLNFVDAKGGLSVADVEATLGMGVDIQLPRSAAVTASVNLGVPLLQSGTRDPITAQLRRLVERISPAAPRADGKRRPRGRHRRTRVGAR